MTLDWEHTDGMMILLGGGADHLLDAVRATDAVIELEWFPGTPELVGLTALTRGGRVAILPEGEDAPVEGPLVEDFVRDLAAALHAEVRLGAHAADEIPDDLIVARMTSAAEEARVNSDAEEEARDADTDTEEGTYRTLEISMTPAHSVPLLASLEGLDMADLARAEGGRAILTEMPALRIGGNFSDVPLVTLAVDDGQVELRLVTDDHLEHVVTHSWGMERHVLPARAAEDEVLADLVGPRPALLTIAAAVPGADAEAVVAALDLPEEEAVVTLVAAFGLPASFAEFLLGERDLDEVDDEGVRHHRATGVSSAIGRSVDLLLAEKDSPVHPLLDTYSSVVDQRPWIANALLSAEAAAGATLLVLAARTPRPRSGWVKLGGFVGACLVVDSIADLTVSRWLARTREARG